MKIIKEMRPPERIWKIMLFVYCCGLALISGLAYADELPAWLFQIPYYDKVAHFFLLGTLSLLTHKVLRRNVLIFGILISLAPILISCYSIGDEFFQKVSPFRTFDVFDILANLVGIWFFYALYKIYQRLRLHFIV